MSNYLLDFEKSQQLLKNCANGNNKIVSQWETTPSCPGTNGMSATPHDKSKTFSVSWYFVMLLLLLQDYKVFPGSPHCSAICSPPPSWWGKNPHLRLVGEQLWRGGEMAPHLHTRVGRSLATIKKGLVNFFIILN